MSRKMDRLLFVGICIMFWGIFTSVTALGVSQILVLIPLVLILKKHSQLIVFSKSSAIFCLLILTGYLSSLYNLSELNDVTRSLGRQKYKVIGLLSLWVLPFYFKNYMSSSRIKKLFNIFVVMIALAFVFGFILSYLKFDIKNFEFVAYGYRNPGLTGIMRYGYGIGFVLSALLSLAINYDYEKFITKRWLYSGILLALLGLLTSQCRGAILGTCVSIPFILWFKYRKLAYLSTLVGGGALGFVLYLMIADAGQSRLVQSASSASNLIRLSQYEAAYKALKERPFLGFGENQFSSICPKIKAKHNIDWRKYCSKLNLDCDHSDKKPYCGHAHNIFLQTGADLGIIGLTLFVLWLIFWFYEAWHAAPLIKYMSIPLIINFAAAGQFEYALDANNSVLIFMTYALLNIKSVKL